MSKQTASKKILSMVLFLSIVFSLFIVKGSLAYASSREKENKNVSISSETQITNENIYDVLDYLEIDKNKFEKTSIAPKNSIDLTVGELSNILNSSNLNKTITDSVVVDTSNHELELSDVISPYATSYTSTKYRDVKYGSVTIRYSATGRYTIYDVPSPGEPFYWTQALGGDIDVHDSDFGTTHSIRNISTCITSIQSGALTLTYNFDVDYYIALKVGFLHTGTNNFKGYTKWPNP
jgi:hypothetical protein